MKLPYLLSLVFIVIFSFLGFTQQNELLQNINGKLNRYTATESPEKVYVQTDKDIYVNGETVWYKAYLLDGVTHNISDKSNVVYVELVNAQDSVVVQQKLFAESVGVAGNIDIPESLGEGNYRLSAYSKYMLNEKQPAIFSKQIAIWKPENKVSKMIPAPRSKERPSTTKPDNKLTVDFFPEGGTLIYGIENTLGIKITNAKGNEISTYGKIVDQNNTFIKDFETFEFGLGKVSYSPEAGKTYYASITIEGQEKKYNLPTPENKGYVLNVVQTPEYITIKATSNINDGLKGSLLVGHSRGRVFLSHTKESSDPSFLIKIPMETMVDGVAHFTLFTSAGEPVCERLIFINNPDNDYTLKIETPLANYQKRQKVDVALILESMQGKEPSGSFSASVISKAAKTGHAAQNIESWLLLNSDLGGTVQNAGFFFEEETAKKRFLLDALMLTHGWRRFVWKEMLNNNVSKNLVYEPEKGIMISGKTTAFDNKYQPKASKVKLLLIDDDFYQEQKATELNGDFSFGPFFFQDSIPLVLQSTPITKAKNKSDNDFSIQVETRQPAINYSNLSQPENNTLAYKYPKEYIDIASQKKQVDFILNPNTIRLEEVVVTEKQKTRKEIIDERISEVVFHNEPDHRVFADSIIGGTGSYNSVFDMLRGLPGVRVFGPGLDSIRIRSSGTPLILVNGSPTPIEFINTINPFDVEFIDVLKNSGAAAYGHKAFDGVVAIYLKGVLGLSGLEKNKTPNPNILNSTFKGFYKTREFYSPNYAIVDQKDGLQDFRTTLHWQPDIIMNEQGAPSLNFYTGDVSGSYMIHVEGITEDGTPVSASQFFEVEDDTN
ncbi:TonB-dependent receptor plug domain-containing protein [Cellulophaga sp. Hel_I_12]|uniref:TonB-dependent receptor plug domain-containing protein n=1 Tax=Cellulophaga sp. Hel_I_12 TaxID=1249972 RepID=UPI00064704E1|nr:TonB-dependent receptor plug domain-containing protein [Cellulophaga sp. Hel_I_12]